MFSRCRRVAGDRLDQADELQYRSHSHCKVPRLAPLALFSGLSYERGVVFGFELRGAVLSAQTDARPMAPPDVPADNAVARDLSHQMWPTRAGHVGH